MSAGLIAAAVILGAFLWFLIEKQRRKSHPVTGGRQDGVTLPHTQSLELYANPFSHCSRKATLAMEELGLDYVYHRIDLIETGSYETISPAYLKINPSGLVPTLLHDGVPIYESDDILAYAQSLSSSVRLTPDNPQKQAEMTQWLDFCSISSGDPTGSMKQKAGSCIPGLTLPLFMTMIPEIPLRHIAVGLLFHPDKKRPAFFTAAKVLGLSRMLAAAPLAAMIHESRDCMQAHLATIDRALAASDGPWILGRDFSLADITLGVLYKRLDETCWLKFFMDQAPLPALSAHYEALKARPAWQAAIENRQAGEVARGSARLAEAVTESARIREQLYGSSAAIPAAIEPAANYG